MRADRNNIGMNDMTSEAIIYLLAGILLGSAASFAITMSWAKECAKRFVKTEADMCAISMLNHRLDAGMAGTVHEFDVIMQCEPMREVE